MIENDKIKQTMREIGITPNIKGYHYVMKGVSLIKQDFEDGKSPSSFMKMYREIGDVFGATGTCVERCIRHSIEVARQNDSKLFNSLFGEVKNITSSNFISTIAEYI